LEKKLGGILTINEIKKYQPHFATWIFMELQAETADDQTGVKLGVDNAMKTLKNINMTAQFGRPLI
jgi:3-methyladenine DNA glycosylase AlkC